MLNLSGSAYQLPVRWRPARGRPLSDRWGSAGSDPRRSRRSGDRGRPRGCAVLSPSPTSVRRGGRGATGRSTMTASATSGRHLDTIAQIALTVSDLGRAVGFYRDVLGMPLLFQAPPGLAFFRCGAIRLILSVPEKNFTPGASS